MPSLVIAGLGPGGIDSLPARVFDILRDASIVLLRTKRHPVLQSGPLADALARRVAGSLIALDDEYENNETFDATYAAIAQRVLRTVAAAESETVVYAVPGHPLLGESTVERILRDAKSRGIDVRIFGAPSFVDACLETLGESVTGDLSVVDALALDPERITPAPALRTDGPILLYQVHSRAAASVVKLALMRAGFPDDFGVTVVRGAGLPDALISRIPLYELDRNDHDHLTSVWVPALPDSDRAATFDTLVAIMKRLRDPESGCPWDLKQTHETLRKYCLEEAYEVVEAIDSGDPDALCDELGDLLLQVVFHAQMATESGDFEIGDICAAICDKMIRRHPHIFGGARADTPEAVLANWNAIKATEKADRGEKAAESLLDGVSASLPALSQAIEISRRVVAVGFEWPRIEQIFEKFFEEMDELKAEIDAGAPVERIGDELGDVLFTVVNIARKIGVDPEDALRRQLARFGTRWRFIEAGARKQSRPIESLSLAEMESLWQDAKQVEKFGHS